MVQREQAVGILLSKSRCVGVCDGRESVVVATFLQELHDIHDTSSYKKRFVFIPPVLEI